LEDPGGLPERGRAPKKKTKRKRGEKGRLCDPGDEDERNPKPQTLNPKPFLSKTSARCDPGDEDERKITKRKKRGQRRKKKIKK